MFAPVEIENNEHDLIGQLLSWRFSMRGSFREPPPPPFRRNSAVDGPGASSGRRACN